MFSLLQKCAINHQVTNLPSLNGLKLCRGRSSSFLGKTFNRVTTICSIHSLSVLVLHPYSTPRQWNHVVYLRFVYPPSRLRWDRTICCDKPTIISLQTGTDYKDITRIQDAPSIALPPSDTTCARAIALHSVTKRLNSVASNPLDSRTKCIEIIPRYSTTYMVKQ